ncbi:hypothetical protein SAMN05421688_1345 [Poseidonocella pacifica]|uniref:Uncharacterized protein n=1 Tax=Poseidonocella pacifica TaxID=871651 RepID=A0A1I0WEK5_9RHOB|nr:hypothetical protein SAMN05421688_1345 [Poseidonocella pacifica]
MKFWSIYFGSILTPPVILLVLWEVWGLSLHALWWLAAIYLQIFGIILLSLLLLWPVAGFLAIPFVAVARRKRNDKQWTGRYPNNPSPEGPKS